MSTDKGCLSQTMNALANVDDARRYAQRLETIEANRSGAPLTVVRPTVARRLGVAPGTLENIRRGRVKDVRKHVWDRLTSGLINELQAEMRRYEHELSILRQTGSHPCSDEIAEVEAGLAKAREALGID